MSLGWLPRHPAVAYLCLVRCMRARSQLGAQIVLGLFFLAFAIVGLLRARTALLNHTVVWWYGVYRPGRVWLDPWQAIVGFNVCLALGLFLVINGICRLRKRREN
jgi:hypothetical protein